ncbi:hypothetical protein [Streptomyces hygroscopicus]|uniref:hypothetical protein n=1 Tax=Streptomyces hygroscopicus TaxID=1912 RepID=UPI00223FBD6B|nr:hypothetical protein [Streptomyces hygroscopicus]
MSGGSQAGAVLSNGFRPLGVGVVGGGCDAAGMTGETTAADHTWLGEQYDDPMP